MKKIYEKPQMEAMDIKMQRVLTGSSVTSISGFGYKGAGTGGGRAPMMPDFDEFEDQFDFTDIKLW